MKFKIGEIYELTTEHPASNYGIPVLVDLKGVGYGPSDIPQNNLEFEGLLGKSTTAADIVNFWTEEEVKVTPNDLDAYGPEDLIDVAEFKPVRSMQELRAAQAFCAQWPDGPQVIIKTPSPQSPHKGTKESRAMAAYDGFKGGATVVHVKKLVGTELVSRLTGHELGLVMSAVNRAWHEAKTSMGAEVIDGDYVWVTCLDKGFDLDVLRRLQKTETSVKNKAYYDGNLCDVTQYRYMTHDGMPYEEQRTCRDFHGIPKSEYGKWYRYEYETVTTWTLSE